MRRTPGLMSVACLLVVAVAAQERPLPEREAFFRETRRHLQTDTSLQSSYVYVETRRDQKLDKRGRVLEESVKVFESYPGLPGENRWERLIAENGRPRPAAELEKVDRDRQRQAEAFARRLTEQPAKERARQERDLAEQRREFEAIVDDIFIVFDIDMRGREAIDGHDTIALSLTPRPKAKPRTHEGRQMRVLLAPGWSDQSCAARRRGHRHAVDGLRCAGSSAQGLAAVVPAAQSEQRGVAAGSRPLPRRYTRRPCPDTPAQRHIGVLGLPQVLRRHRHDVSAAEDAMMRTHSWWSPTRKTSEGVATMIHRITESLVPIHAAASESAAIPKERRRSRRGCANIRLCLCMKRDDARPRRPVVEQSASTIRAAI